MTYYVSSGTLSLTYSLTHADYPRTGHTDTLFTAVTFIFNPVILTYESNLDIRNMYLHTKHEVSRSRLSNVRAQTVQTDATAVVFRR